MPRVSIQCEALTFELELTRANGGDKFEALLEEDAYGWQLAEVTPGRASDAQIREKIGRRKRWQMAVAEALMIMEDALIRREEEAS